MRIIKRKKGNAEYFYLQHSFREGGRVKTRERYLGLSVPENIDEIKMQLEQESKKGLYAKLAEIKAHFNAEWKRLPKSAKERELNEIAIAFTYNTNAIEGSTITLEETREILEDRIAPRKPLEDIKETEAHAKVFLHMLGKKEKITNVLILQWHKDIFGETKKDIAGKFRDYLVRVGTYTAPDWQDITRLMDGFIKYANTNNTNTVELAARAHYRFEKIHPFGDGNGRIGRLVMNYILWHNGYPMLIIERRNRKSYYKALQKNEEGFTGHFMRRYLSIFSIADSSALKHGGVEKLENRE